MFVIEVVSSDNKTVRSSYYMKTVEEAKKLAYLIVSYNSDGSTESELTVSYIEKNFYNLVGTKNNPFVCGLVCETDEQYHLEIYKYDNNFCVCD